jgi:PAS domain S-box-containing protein
MSVSAIDGRWVQINDAYCRMLGYERAELLGLSFVDVTHPEDVRTDHDFVAAALAGRADYREGEKRYVRKDGAIVWAQTRIELIRDLAGEPAYFVSNVQDLSERRAALDLLYDRESTLRSVIDNTPAIISVKDRDHRYTLVNRGFEQFYGVSRDWVIGRRDTEVLPLSLLNEAHAEDRLVLDQGLSTQEEETIVRDGRERVMLHTRYPLRTEDGEIHGVCLASTDVTERRLEERERREHLECSELIYSALAKDRLVLQAQPIICLDSMQPEMAELLLRMREEPGSERLLSPGTFLPAAERFDLITLIDDWVIDQAMGLAANGHRVTVNVSAKTISESGQAERISAVIRNAGAPTENLIFEITETAVAGNLEAARTFALGMRQLGCAVALDDFGVGHGSFTYLRHLPVDYLKIDMQFVRDLLKDEIDRQVVEAIIGVANLFGIKTIAEGVEDEATLHELRSMGVDYAQGYWTGRPAAIHELLPSDHHSGARHVQQAVRT